MPQRKRPSRRKPRAPRIGTTLQAANNKAAKELAEELNAKIEDTKKRGVPYRTNEKVRAENQMRRRRQRLAKNGGVKPRCHGTSMKGEPCKMAPLVPDNWDGDDIPTGLYCWQHDPNLSPTERESYGIFGSAKQPVPRKVTPTEMAHLMIQRAPQHFLRPYLKALGVDIDDEGNMRQVGSGLKLFGYSRGGEVIRSHYPDLVGQVNVAEKLFDRVYGKARQAVDVASQNASVVVHVPMDPARVDKVSQVLADAGALPANGNGNGHGPVNKHAQEELPESIESTAYDKDV